LGQYFCLVAGLVLFVFGLGNVVVHFVYGIDSIRGTALGEEEEAFRYEVNYASND
jgi:hypothetical protein